MNSLAPNLNFSQSEVKISAMLRLIAEYLKADYVLSLFAPSDTEHYRFSTAFSRSATPYKNTDERLKGFAETLFKLKDPQNFDSRDIVKADGTSLNVELPFSNYLFYPLFSAEKPEAMLVIAGSNRIIKSHALPGKLISDFLQITADEAVSQHSAREKLFAAGRQLINIKNEIQLELVIRQQFNPIFNLAASGILVSRKGIDEIRYLFYTNPGIGKESDTEKEDSNFPYIVDVHKHPEFIGMFVRTSPLDMIGYFDFDHEHKPEELFPFMKECADQGIRKFAVLPLTKDSEVLGYWLMAFNKTNSPALFCNEVYQIAAEHLVAAIYAVRVHNALKDKAGEADVLQWLNQLLATSKDRKSLIRTVRGRLENLFAFSHSFICGVNDDDLTMTLLLSDSQSRSQFHPEYQKLKTQKVTIADGISNKVLLTTEPIVFDLKKLSKIRTLPLYLSVNLDSGISKVLMLCLRINTKVIGIWVICFTEEQTILPRYLELVKTVAAPISMAVANINMENSLQKRDSERDALMSLSSDITSVKNKERLLSVLIDQLNRLFGNSDIFCFVIKEHKTVVPFLNSARTVPSFTEMKCPCNEHDCDCSHLTDKLLNLKDVNILDITEFTNHAQLNPFFAGRQNSGIKNVVTMSLKNDDRQIGVFCLCLREGEFFTDHELSLFKEVAYQVAKAVSNIMANEEISRRNREKELLLELSKELASVRHKEQLIAATRRSLKAALGFSHIALCLKTEEQIISFALDPESRIKDHSDYHQFTRNQIPFNNEWVKIFEDSIEPVYIRKGETGNMPEISPIMRLNFESGITEMIVTKLYNGIDYFGFLVIFNEQRSQDNSHLGLIQSIASQVSIAMLNVIANQEISDRDEVKEYLIQLSNATAGIRSYMEFFQFANKKFAQKFGYGESAMVITGPEGNTVEKILSEENAENLCEIFPAKDFFKNTDEDHLLPFLTKGTAPFIVRRDDTAGKPYANLVRLFPSEQSLDTMMITKFRHRNKILGLWIMYFRRDHNIDKRQFSLMEAINDQLALVIRNITANEKEALFASQKSILFSLSQQVTASRTLAGLVKAIDLHVKTVLNYHHTNINLLDESGKHLLPWINQGVPEDGRQKSPDLKVLTPVKDVLIEQAMLTGEPQLFDIVNFPPGLADSGDFESHRNSPVKQALLTRLEVNGEVLGLWVICFRERPLITGDYFDLVKGIRDTLSLAILNITLNEKIRRREHEKSVLLDFSRSIAGVKDKFQLRSIFNRYLKNLCNLEELGLHWLDEQKTNRYLYFWDDGAAYTKDPEFNLIAERSFPVNDGVYDVVLATAAPVTVDVIEFCDRPDTPLCWRFLKKCGCSQIVAMPLFKGEEIVAALLVRPNNLNEIDQPLFRSLSSQLAIAVSDLIASERIVQQLAEINQYKERLEEEKVYLSQELETTHNYSEIIGKSAALGEVFNMISKVAATESTVLITGETGTGKELIARAIHNDSPRKNKLMVKVNCAALPASLIESELFGHEKGSFTGATERRLGKFELAHGGTLFLDEIGEMPPELQVKLLRALQEKEIERIGGKGIIKVDVRIIVATNRNLEEEITAGRFRKDLYFRISTFPIHLPALRDRPEDIPLLAGHFITRFAKRSGKVIENIGNRAMAELMAYKWPGNVRELEHQIERCVLMTNGSTMKEVYLPSAPAGTAKETASAVFMPGNFDDFEKDFIVKTLRYCNGKVSGTGGAAEILGIPASTLTSRMKRLNITKKFLKNELGQFSDQGLKHIVI